MTVRGLRRIIVSVAELDRALAFYRDALGWAEKYRAGEAVMLALPGTDLELLLHERPPTPGPSTSRKTPRSSCTARASAPPKLRSSAALPKAPLKATSSAPTPRACPCAWKNS